MPRILLIRHAPTAETGRKLTGRLPGVSLDSVGMEAAAKAGERLRNLHLEAIYTSPIERTRETAVLIAQHQRCDPVVHEGLTEVDYGNWSGRSLASLRRLKAWSTVQMTPSRVKFPEGETILAAQSRAVAAIEEIAARHTRTVACVSHADVIKAIISHYLGQPLDLFQRIAISPASISALSLERGKPPSVLTVNSTGNPI